MLYCNVFRGGNALDSPRQGWIASRKPVVRKAGRLQAGSLRYSRLETCATFGGVGSSVDKVKDKVKDEVKDEVKDKVKDKVKEGVGLPAYKRRIKCGCTYIPANIAAILLKNPFLC